MIIDLMKIEAAIAAYKTAIENSPHTEAEATQAQRQINQCGSDVVLSCSSLYDIEDDMTEHDAERASATAVEYAAVSDRLNAVRQQAVLADKRYGDPPRSTCICWSDIVGMLTDIIDDIEWHVAAINEELANQFGDDGRPQ